VNTRGDIDVLQRDAIPAVLAYAVVLGFFGALVMVVTVKMDPSIKDVLLLLMGQLSSKFGSTYDYFFGSSSGSAKLREALTDQLSTQSEKQ